MNAFVGSEPEGSKNSSGHHHGQRQSRRAQVKEEDGFSLTVHSKQYTGLSYMEQESYRTF